jgi:hypothetical protein
MYSKTWPRLVDNGAAPENAIWMRSRKWVGRVNFFRSSAVGLSVNEAQCARLENLRRLIGWWEKDVYRDVLAAALKWPRMRREKTNKKGKVSVRTAMSWPDDFSRNVLAVVNMSIAREWEKRDDGPPAFLAPIQPGGWEWTALTRSLTRELGEFERQVKNGQTPTRSLSAITTVRLGGGILYGAPLTQEKDFLEIEGLGRVYVPDAPESVELAWYCEVALIRRTWMIRFVFTSEKRVPATFSVSRVK